MWEPCSIAWCQPVIVKKRKNNCLDKYILLKWQWSSKNCKHKKSWSNWWWEGSGQLHNANLSTGEHCKQGSFVSWFKNSKAVLSVVVSWFKDWKAVLIRSSVSSVVGCSKLVVGWSNFSSGLVKVSSVVGWSNFQWKIFLFLDFFFAGQCIVCSSLSLWWRISRAHPISGWDSYLETMGSFCL